MECNVCSQGYSLSNNRVPFVLGCGHSVCSRCLEALLMEECPTCRKPIQSKNKNFALLEMIERSKSQTPNKKQKKDIEELFKVSVVGESSVGKTTMIHYITKGEFKSNTIPTIGVDFTYIDRDISSKTYRFQLWDTAGQEQYRCIAKNHYLNSDVIILVYSVNEVSTFDQLEDYWVREIAEVAPDAKIVLVGNKCDLKRLVPIERIEAFSQKYHAPHHEVSCKSHTGVLSVWQHIVRDQTKMRHQREKKMGMRIQKGGERKSGFFEKLKNCWSFLF